jgi:hypothetical protein
LSLRNNIVIPAKAGMTVLLRRPTFQILRPVHIPDLEGQRHNPRTGVRNPAAHRPIPICFEPPDQFTRKLHRP